MGDSNDPTSAAAGGEGVKRGLGRAKGIVDELVDALRSAAESVAGEQQLRAAERVAALAEAVRCAARSLDQSESPAIARYAQSAADQVDHWSRVVGQRNWRGIIADTEDFARRQPVLFALGAVAAGFLAGRFLSVPAGRRAGEGCEARQRADLARSRGETDQITAAGSKPAAITGGGGNGAPATPENF